MDNGLSGPIWLPGAGAMLCGGLLRMWWAWHLSPAGNPELAEFQAFVVLGELLAPGCFLRQKISFFRKVWGDFLFGKFRSILQKMGEGVFILQF